MGIIREIIPNNSPSHELPPIFKLKMDHFEEIFEWLSIKDLVMLGQTCNRMKQIVGYYIKMHYTATVFNYEEDGIYAEFPPLVRRNCFHVERSKVDGFHAYMRKLAIYDLEYVPCDGSKDTCENSTKIIPHMKANSFKSLTELQLWNAILTDNGISRIKEILEHLETVQMEQSYFSDENDEFYESFLQYCTNIKKLCIHEVWNPKRADKAIIGADNSWLLRKYPKLEYFELTTNGEHNRNINGQIHELPTFFEQNTNIKTFATNIEVILENIDTFKNTKAKWDVLCLHYDYIEALIPSKDLLNELHANGLFNEFHLYICEVKFEQEIANQLISFNGFTKLFNDMTDLYLDLSPLTNIKHLCINNNCDNMEAVSKNLINLEIFELKCAPFDYILPFILYSPKLTTIVVLNDINNGTAIFNIDKLNKERSKLHNARKITIYVEENTYLTAKWATNKTNWSLIQIKRVESYDALYHNFYWTNDVMR